MIVELVRTGHRVGVSAQAHKAITNLLVETVLAAREAGVPIRALQRIDGDGADHSTRWQRPRTPRSPRRWRPAPWTSSPARAGCSPGPSSTGRSTSLFVDEAGQQSLANAVAGATAAARSSCWATRTSCPRSARASTPTAPGRRPWSTSWGPIARSRPSAACSCRSPTGCTRGSRRVRVGAVLRRPPRDRPGQCDPGDRRRPGPGSAIGPWTTPATRPARPRGRRGGRARRRVSSASRGRTSTGSPGR